MQHADHFTRILNEKENFRREKFSESRSENNSVNAEENIENLDQTENNDLLETSSEETKIQKSEKPQVEIN